MGLLGTLASLFGLETDTLLQRAKESAVAYAAIGLFCLIAIAFLLVAAHMALASWVGPVWSSLIIAAAALVIALILFIALRIQIAAQKRRERERRLQAESTALVAGAVMDVLPELVASPLIRSIGLPIALYAAALILAGPRRTPARTDKR